MEYIDTNELRKGKVVVSIVRYNPSPENSRREVCHPVNFVPQSVDFDVIP